MFHFDCELPFPTPNTVVPSTKVINLPYILNFQEKFSLFFFIPYFSLCNFLIFPYEYLS